jgi:hypothetical protein
VLIVPYIRDIIAIASAIVIIYHGNIRIINTGRVAYRMHDVVEESASESTYECLQCGKIVERKTHPGECSCGGSFQNRAMSLE